jgi:D-arabinose 1-dehydrogenase-like Zn-dependent alcohol dehydrogenase
MPTLHAAQIKKPNSKFEMIEKEIPQPGPKHVRVKIQACGICHSDVLTQSDQWPGIEYPRIPGHEITGTVEELGSDIPPIWKEGQRVGVGWDGGYCGYCTSCRHGDFINCLNLTVPGIHYDGGYADYAIVPANSLVALPDELSFEEAAPMLCAGITTFNALRHSGAIAGDVVAIQGIGGLGHLAIQFAHKMGFKTIAISSGSDKEALVKKLGADVYIDSGKQNPASELKRHGGARVILSTVPSGKAMSSLIDGLGRDGVLIAIGVSSDPIEVTPLQLIGGRHRIQGWPAGSPSDSEETLRFCVLHGVRAMIEKFPLQQAQVAFDKMLTGEMRFRGVLTQSL